MKSVKKNYIRYLQTEVGSKKYIAFKKILYSESDSLVQVLNNNFLPLLKLYKKSSISACDVGGGDGFRIINILTYLYNKYHIKFELDFIEQSTIYCNLFRNESNKIGNFCEFIIHNDLFENINLDKEYDLLFLIHSIFAFDNGKAVNKLLDLIKKDGHIIVMSNSTDSLLAKIKRKIDVDFDDDRFEIDDLIKILDYQGIKYTNSYFVTEWTIEEYFLDKNLNTILHWLSLGNYDRYSSERKMDLKEFIISQSQKYNNLYLFKEKEQVLFIPKL